MTDQELMHEIESRYLNDTEFYTTVNQAVNFVLAGPIPFPYSSEEELNSMRTILIITASATLIFNNGEYLYLF